MYVLMDSITITFLFHIFLHSFLLQSVCQQCPFPNQRCICITSQPVCNCPYITANSSLNLTTGYNSHLVTMTGLGCLPCPSSCLGCSSMNVCTSCRNQYVLIENNCIRCPINCNQCQVFGSIVSGQPYPLLCTQCMNTYYLDSQNQCQVCPFVGSNICTVDTIVSCIPSYSLDSNGATCISCDPNCNSCSSTTKCSLCNDGYYLSSFKCQKCMDQCSTCTNYAICTSCLGNGQYFNLLTSSCETCPGGCLSCNSSSFCSVCGDSNNNSYILYSNGTCILTTNPIINCQQQYQYTANNLTYLNCSQCNADYFQQVSSSQCYYSCSILCQQCQGAHYGLCTSCRTQYANLFNRQCLPKNNVNNGSAYQIYFTAMNDYNSSSIIGNYTLLTRLANPCLKQSILFSDELSIELDNLQSYKIMFIWKIYAFSTNSSQNQGFSYYLSFNNTNTTYTYTFTCQKTLNDTDCTNICINKNTATILTNVLQYNTVTFGSNSGKIGLSQVLIIAYRCGGVQGSSCLECSSINICNKCVNPEFYILGAICVQQCPPNYYVYFIEKECFQVCPMGTYPVTESNGTQVCYQCPMQCKACSSPLLCVSCNIGYFLVSQTQQCLPICPSKYFPNSYLHTCQKCLYPCLQCTDNRQCLSCMYGFYDNITETCTVICAVGYYGDLQTRICEPCASPCLTCQLTSTTCLECLPSFMQFYGLCYSNCPSGNYMASDNTSQLSCLPCNITCLTCTSSNICTSCSSGFLLNFTCYLPCPMGYYASLSSKKCELCSDNCLACTQATRCSVCKAPFVLDFDLYVCKESCGDLQYPQQQNYYSFIGQSNNNIYYVCEVCTPPCYACLSSTQCISCLSSFLINNSCVGICIFGTYANQNDFTCTDCPSNCTTCQSEQTCTSCLASFVLYNGVCLEECPPFFYSYFDIGINSNVCLSCSSDCFHCLNQSFCINCSQEFYNNNQGQCVDLCPSGYWPNSETYLCVKCMDYCIACQYNTLLQQEQCIACSSPYFLNTLNNQSTCVLACEAEEFGNNGICYTCTEPCLSCISQSQCIGCKNGYGFALMGDCLTSCPPTFYENGNNTNGYICSPCPSQCLSCMSISLNLSQLICTQCQNNYFLNKLNFTCIQSEQCQYMIDPLLQNQSYFPDMATKLCAKCFSRCSKCEGEAGNCLTCNDGYFYYFDDNANVGNCLSFCPIGFFVQNGVCSSCNNATQQNNNLFPLACIKCISPSLCLSCASPYYLYSNLTFSICMLICPDGYFGYAQLCRPCAFPCVTCSSLTNCMICADGFANLINANNESICVNECPSGYFANVGNTFAECIPCALPCLQCLFQSNCLICKPPAVLINNTCHSQCPLGTFQFYGTCSQCMLGCSNCTDAYTCFECTVGILYQNQCVNSCPYGLIFQSVGNRSTCQTCHSQCLTCIISPTYCTSCTFGLFLYLQSCLDVCPSGSYANIQLSQCITCTSPCQTCINSNSCQTCIYGYILYIQPTRNQCVKGPLCPNTFYLDLQMNQCVTSCNSDKYSEPISRICSTSCPQGFAAYDNNMTCLQNCPGNNSWVDQHNKCQQNKQSLSSQFINSHLPYFSCQFSNYLNLLKIYCNFSLPITNLPQLTINNITVQNLKILYFQASNNNTGFNIFVQPFDLTILENCKYSHQLIKVSLRPRYNLRTFVSIMSSDNRILQQQSTDNYYPLQNSDISLYLEVYNFYTLGQRQTGIYLQQLANSISIAALIIWVFSLLKNKKTMALIWVHGLQWLYLLSTLGWNSFPPNTLRLLQGFRYSALNFISASPSANFMKRENLWISFVSLRAQLISPFNFMDEKTMLIPLSILIACFVLLILLLILLRTIITKIVEHKVDTQQKSVEEHTQMSLKHKTHKKQSDKKNRNEQKHEQKVVNQLQKKLTIILMRFKFNYANHAFLFISVPLAVCFFSQLVAPSIIGLILSVILVVFYFGLFVVIVKQLVSTKHSLYKEESYKYFILFTMENFTIGFFCIFGSMAIFMGVNAIICILNFFAYFRIFRTLQWKLKFWVIAEILRLLIIASLMVSYIMADEWYRDTLYQYGWTTVVLVFIYVLMLAAMAGRDFFEQQSMAFKELTQKELKMKEKKKSKIIDQLLKSSKFVNKEIEQVNSSILKPIISVQSEVQYSSEQSFFEDEEETIYTDSDENENDAIDKKEIQSYNNEGIAGAPKFLIKQKRVNMEE